MSAYQEALELTRDLYKSGLGNDEAVAQAESQLKATQAQDTNLGVLRAAVRTRHRASYRPACVDFCASRAGS